jgi:hypothetical protein
MIDLDKSRGMLVEVIAENVDLRGHDHPDRFIPQAIDSFLRGD